MANKHISSRERRETWRPVLAAEIKRWSVKSCEQLIAELRNEQIYAVVYKGKNHQVEVRVLENTKDYLHIAVSVDDGTVPTSFRPLTESFILQKKK